MFALLATIIKKAPGSSRCTRCCCVCTVRIRMHKCSRSIVLSTDFPVSFLSVIHSFVISLIHVLHLYCFYLPLWPSVVLAVCIWVPFTKAGGRVPGISMKTSLMIFTTILLTTISAHGSNPVWVRVKYSSYLVRVSPGWILIFIVHCISRWPHYIYIYIYIRRKSETVATMLLQICMGLPYIIWNSGAQVYNMVSKVYSIIPNLAPSIVKMWPPS